MVDSGRGGLEYFPVREGREDDVIFDIICHHAYKVAHHRDGPPRLLEALRKARTDEVKSTVHVTPTVFPTQPIFKAKLQSARPDLAKPHPVAVRRALGRLAFFQDVLAARRLGPVHVQDVDRYKSVE